jgi:hypothetical protein
MLLRCLAISARARDLHERARLIEGGDAKHFAPSKEEEQIAFRSTHGISRTVAQL